MAQRMSYHELVTALGNRPQDARPLDTPLMDTNMRRLRDVRKRCAEDDLRDGPPRCRVKVVGDPEIWDSQGRCFHYLGPALLVNLDDRGMVRSLEFVGVKPDNDYISEVWHFDVKTQKYKYRNLSNMQGTPSSNLQQIACFDADEGADEPQFQAGDASWISDAAPHAMPPPSFLKKFKSDSETFFVDCRSGMFVRGPNYGLSKGAIENPAKLVKPLFASCSMDARVWMQHAAGEIERADGQFLRPCRETQVVQLAQLVYGLTAGVCVV